ncbi:transposase [Methylocapsa palsarum]|uniref:ISXO2-like transposase domain-containing protein n=1 Tax=Methylocapsa palsarum TaxID=1612308 RepID=A0A1I3VZF5_9HYPH|nr:transposase [Methylocapsa palsarum]SFJ99606.1 ISXO2-like transposase domain-containing protein [Methylocapsa palsarum]
MEELNSLETAILEKMLSGNNESFNTQRQKYRSAKVTERSSTGVGFFTHFHVPPNVARLTDREGLEIGDVSAEIVGLKYGADFVLFVKDGAIDTLEGFCYDEAWPARAIATNIFYNGLLRPIIAKNVEAASVLMTDEATIYRGIGKKFGAHHTVIHSANEYARLGSYIHINSAENFFSIVKRGIIGSYHHVSEAHLHRYMWASSTIAITLARLLILSVSQRLSPALSGSA